MDKVKRQDSTCISSERRAMKADGIPKMKTLTPSSRKLKQMKVEGIARFWLNRFQGFIDQANKTVSTMSYKYGCGSTLKNTEFFG